MPNRLCVNRPPPSCVWPMANPSEIEPAAARCGLDVDELLIIDPERFQNGADGPCHTPAVHTQLWTDVLRSLELSFDLIADEARTFNQERLQFMPG